METNIGKAVIGATLLTLEQAAGLPQNILKSDNRWWLRTPGYTKSTATCVSADGTIDGFGTNVETCSAGIRPVLLLKADAEISLNKNKETNLTPAGQKEPIKFYFIGKDENGHGMLIPEKCVSKGQFKTDWKSMTANQYTDSDAKSKVDAFAEMMKDCVCSIARSVQPRNTNRPVKATNPVQPVMESEGIMFLDGELLPWDDEQAPIRTKIFRKAMPKHKKRK